ncbi:bifunctional hydroxymethylpyrimidine kinase/phosphomethylpyrimidine kinase [Roseateles sp. SL47]|uniref:bifunctional hydroxymethylpyrimidine kinase/phosphomethylpyrimidine kinase n=1 Tax=Roseateles sp. SL47 TaxID=2995138 RepID=UPI00226F2A6F|nr:bifunctional hydroxymethylpyrimidine kinase/phosphomethylpyrimidine kinase [Roseateles sp. SL47]WAC74672.1 bifunctional hydroxymethylpyrimidine kinase/phosphomethylpyrimidine kinase [Roseateles sp. SL47]
MIRVPHPCLPSPWSPAVDPWQEVLPAWTEAAEPPVIWSVAGTDSGGGAGLAADTRAAAAMGVHLCTVVAAVTAQNSLGVQGVYPVEAATLRGQLQALRADLPARVIKTGLLASATAVDVLLAQRGDALLVVDPVLGATAGGAAFCDDALLAAYRHQVLPQATLVTPNRREAERLLGVHPGQCTVPELACRLRRLGAQAVCITGGDDLSAGTALALDWLDSPLATGWMALPRLAPVPGHPLHHHGSGCTFATAAAAALARGFPLPDAVVLAKMLTWTALRHGHAAGAGAGPLRPCASFVSDAAAMPVMSQADEAVLTEALLAQWARALRPNAAEEATEDAAAVSFARGLYAITDDPGQTAVYAQSGAFAHVQLRIKQVRVAGGRKGPGGLSDADADADADVDVDVDADADGDANANANANANDRDRDRDRDGSTNEAQLRQSIRQAISAVHGTSATLWINDHWRLALEEGATALHLGQEDWAALTSSERLQLLTALRHHQLRLGLSSHSLWELCRARALRPSYIACGPLWPTTTKDMPWQPQGLAQLAWWARMAGRPVVGIGGLLEEAQVQAAWRAGASAVCLVRAAAQWLPPAGGHSP